MTSGSRSGSQVGNQFPPEPEILGSPAETQNPLGSHSPLYVPRRGTSRGAWRNCAVCRQPFADPPRRGRPFVRCPDCRFDYAKGAKNGSRAGERHTPRFKYVPPSGHRVVDVVAPGQYGETDVRDWRESSACFGMDPDIFFGPDTETPESEAVRKLRERVAKGVCGGCPVSRECLDYALQINERHGIWGGLTPRERRRSR